MTNRPIRANADIDFKNRTITIDFNCKKPIQFLFKHELTHFGETSELYQDFVDNIRTSSVYIEWLQAKTGENINSVGKLEGIYRDMVIESRKSVAPVGITEAQQEMYADFCGDVLFSNNQNALNRFMDSLDKKERPKFIQFILDFITYLKEKIAGNKQVTLELVKLENQFAQMLNNAKENTDQTGGVKYDIINLDTGKSYVRAARQVIHGNSVAEWRSQISNFFNKALKNGPLEIKTIEGDILTISKDTAKKARSKAVVENGAVRELTDKEFLVKLNAEAHIDELAEISKRNKGNVVPDSKNHNFAKDGFTYRTVYFQDFDDAYYRVTLSVGENNGISTVYNVGKIKADDIPDGNIISTIGSKADMSSAKNSISTNEPDVNQEYLTAVNNNDMETAQRLVDEAARKAGYETEAYHGTPNETFTVFDKERVGKGNDQYGAGFYFASDKTAASHYGNRVINAVLNIKNPIRITATADSGRNLIDANIELTSEEAYEVIKRHPDMYDEENSPLGDYFDSYWESGAEDWMIESLAEQYRDVGYLDSDLFRNYPNELHEALRDVVGYDGVEVTFENTGEKFYIAWFDNQMKSADPVTYDDNGEVVPLSERFDREKKDIRYSISVDENIANYTEEQYNNFGWVRYNNVLTSAEYNTLLSRYADYEHNKDMYPTTRFGESVIFSFDYLDVFMYVKGGIRNPQITKVVRINKTDAADLSVIREEIITNEFERQLLPYSFIEKYYGPEVLDICKARDYAPYREFDGRTKRDGGKASHSAIGTKQDGRGSGQKNNGNDRADLEKSAFSMPENKKYSVSTEQHSDIPAEMQRLIQQRDNGEIDADKFTEQMDAF